MKPKLAETEPTHRESGVDDRRLVRCLRKAAEKLERDKEYNARLCEELREGMSEAWKIIDVLYMDAHAHDGESWPRAREWQEKWAVFSANDEPSHPDDNDHGN